MRKKKVEIFIAGSDLCKPVVELVMRNVDSSHEVVISNVHNSDVASRAIRYGIGAVPAVVIDGYLCPC
jgi:hypothetical protein